MEMGKINYVGALGNDNMGDEALYQINKKVFKSYELVPSLRRQCSGITLLGGGTLIPEWTVLVLPNTYNYAFGVGVKNPSFFEKAQPLWIHPITIEQTKRFNFRLFGVRGEMSKRTLTQWGIDSEVVGDPCLLFEPTAYNKKEDDKIAINVGWSRGGVWGDDEEKVLKETVRLCEVLVADHYRPVLVPFWIEDVPYIQRISSQADIEIFEDWGNTQKLL
ncbi:MAG: polysaccharide pyruvyl transferase family protein, partial [Thermoplasmata archaeon]|nr:polysaccharide pyruvyl transferase family protein [Thermoplasmata archaeon]